MVKTIIWCKYYAKTFSTDLRILTRFAGFRYQRLSPTLSMRAHRITIIIVFSSFRKRVITQNQSASTGNILKSKINSLFLNSFFHFDFVRTLYTLIPVTKKRFALTLHLLLFSVYETLILVDGDLKCDNV